jgi:hypothetical protein
MMHYHLFKRPITLGILGLTCFLGCEPQLPQPNSGSEKPPKVTLDDVKQNAAKSLTTTATYSQQEKEKLLAAMQTQFEAMDASIAKLRLQGAELASDAKTRWDLKMAALEEKRETAKEKIAEISKSTSKAWIDVEKGAKTAWEELSKAFLEASKEFEEIK